MFYSKDHSIVPDRYFYSHFQSILSQKVNTFNRKGIKLYKSSSDILRVRIFYLKSKLNSFRKSKIYSRHFYMIFFLIYKKKRFAELGFILDLIYHFHKSLNLFIFCYLAKQSYSEGDRLDLIYNLCLLFYKLFIMFFCFFFILYLN